MGKKGSRLAAIFITAILVCGLSQNTSAALWKEKGQPETGLVEYDDCTAENGIITGIYYGLKDSNGNVVIPAKYYSIEYAAGYIIVQNPKNDRYSLYNVTGELVYPNEVTGIRLLSEEDLLFCLIENGQIGVFRPGYGMVIPFGRYDWIGNYAKGCFVAKKDEKYGIVDWTGKILLAFKYDLVKMDETNGGENYYISYGVYNGKTTIAGSIGGTPIYGPAIDYGEGLLVTQLKPTPFAFEDSSAQATFYDVFVTDYFFQPVQWAVENNITSGTTATTFSPNATCTTAQILTFIWRAVGSPEPVIGNPFTDVKSSDYYYKAALWAYENDLISGNRLDGNTPCTRGVTMTYLWKLAGTPDAGTSSFADVGEYSEAVAWAVQQGITSGTSPAAFSPDAICTRGQIMTFLYRDLG